MLVGSNWPRLFAASSSCYRFIENLNWIFLSINFGLNFACGHLVDGFINRPFCSETVDNLLDSVNRFNFNKTEYRSLRNCIWVFMSKTQGNIPEKGIALSNSIVNWILRLQFRIGLCFSTLFHTGCDNAIDLYQLHSSVFMHTIALGTAVQLYVVNLFFFERYHSMK